MTIPDKTDENEDGDNEEDKNDEEDISKMKIVVDIKAIMIAIEQRFLPGRQKGEIKDGLCKSAHPASLLWK